MVNLVTIQEFKNYKEINSEQYDPIISSLIGAVSQYIKEYTGRQFIEYANRDKVEVFDATIYPEYYPEEIPIISVTSLEVSTDGGVTYTALTENVDFFVDYNNSSIISAINSYYFVSSNIGTNSGRLTYKGGYLTTPQDLKLAVMELVDYYRNREYVQNKSMSGASTTGTDLLNIASILPPHIKRILDNYRLI